MHAKIFLQTAIVLIRGCLQISSALNRPAGRIRALDPLFIKKLSSIEAEKPVCELFAHTPVSCSISRRSASR